MGDKRNSMMWVEAVTVNETRDGEACKILRVRGYAILWNSPSERMGSWDGESGGVIETIDARALDGLGDLNSLDIRMQGEHKDLALARTGNGSLRLVKDARGLMIEADLDSRRADARNLYYAIERGDVSQMSFGFMIGKGGETITETDDGTIRAHVTRISRLLEVSAVTFPAYRATSIGAVGEVCAVCGTTDCACGDGEDMPDVVDRSYTAELARLRALREWSA